MPIRLWRAERDFKSFVGQTQEFTGKLCSNIEGYRKVKSIDWLVEKMFELSTSTENLYAIAKQRGYTNRTMTAASLNLIRDHGQQIFDIAETLGLILDPATDERFRLAREEQERGECVGMEVFS